MDTWKLFTIVIVAIALTLAFYTFTEVAWGYSPWSISSAGTIAANPADGSLYCSSLADGWTNGCTETGASAAAKWVNSIVVPADCAEVAVILQTSVFTTKGSAETSDWGIRVRSGVEGDTLTTYSYGSIANTASSQFDVGIETVNVVAGDRIKVYIQNPTWATNPLSWGPQYTMYCADEPTSSGGGSTDTTGIENQLAMLTQGIVVLAAFFFSFFVYGTSIAAYRNRK